MSIPLEFQGDDKGVVALLGNLVDQMTELKRRQAEVARDAARLNKAQLAHLKDVSASTKDVGKTVAAEAKKSRDEIKKWALAYGAVNAGIAAIKASYRVLDAGAQHMRRFRDESIAAYRAAKQSTEQWTLALQANNQQIEQQIANVRAISRVSPFSPNEVRGVQSTLAPNANPAMLGKLTQVSVDTAARSGKSNQEVANKINELALGGTLGNDWLQMGLSADFVQRQNAILAGQARMRSLSEGIAGARGSGQWSMQDQKNLLELNTLRGQFGGQNVADNTINELARQNGGAAMRLAQSRPDLQVGARWTEVLEKIGEWWEQSLLPLYRKTADTLNQVLADMERLGDTSKYLSNLWDEASASVGRMFSGQGMTGTEQGIVDLVSQLWADLKEMLMGVLQALWAGLSEVFRIGALQLENAIAPAVRALPGGGGFRSSLEIGKMAGSQNAIERESAAFLAASRAASGDDTLSARFSAINATRDLRSPVENLRALQAEGLLGADFASQAANVGQFNASGFFAGVRRFTAGAGSAVSNVSKGELNVLDLASQVSGSASGRTNSAGMAKAPAAAAASGDPVVGMLGAILGVLTQGQVQTQRQALAPAGGMT